MTWEEAKQIAFDEMNGTFNKKHWVILDAAGNLLEAHYTQQITLTVPHGCVVVVEDFETKK